MRSRPTQATGRQSVLQSLVEASEQPWLELVLSKLSMEGISLLYQLVQAE